MVLEAAAGDITAGYSFSPGEKNITDTKLNSVVGSATINTTFFTAQPATSTPAAGDLLLIYSSGGLGFRKCAVSDFSATLYPSAFAYDSNLSNGCLFAEWNPGAGAMYGTGPTNIWLAGLSMTNLAQGTIMGQSNLFLIWDASAGTHKAITLTNLVKGLPQLTVTDPQDRILLWSQGTNSNLGATGTLASITLTNLAAAVQTNMNLWKPITFAFTNPFTVDISGVMAPSHGLPGTPQSVQFTLQCVATDGNLQPGQEIPFENIYLGPATVAATTNAFAVKWSPSILWCAPYPGSVAVPSALQTWDAAAGNGRLTLTMSKWKTVVRATYFP
ncbi:MAG TPA: hypothetical protein VHA37_04555 [Candidatus Saccharimonadales bacterium]|nr:hypothetical protein [Candidatus Saccharimonadales bacterium]